MFISIATKPASQPGHLNSGKNSRKDEDMTLSPFLLQCLLQVQKQQVLALRVYRLLIIYHIVLLGVKKKQKNFVLILKLLLKIYITRFTLLQSEISFTKQNWSFYANLMAGLGVKKKFCLKLIG